jgi:hypothetical protein
VPPVYVLNDLYTHTKRTMTKITKAKTSEIVDMLSEGHSLVQACQKTGISRTGLYKRMAADEELRTAVYTARAQSAERALEELDGMYLNALEGRRRYDPNILRDYAHHVRWKAKTSMPDQYGEQKNRAGVEVTDGGIRIMWETD